MHRLDKEKLKQLIQKIVNNFNSLGFYTDVGFFELYDDEDPDTLQDTILRVICTGPIGPDILIYDYEFNPENDSMSVWHITVSKKAHFEAKKKYNVENNSLLYEAGLDTVLDFVESKDMQDFVFEGEKPLSEIIG